MATRRIALVTGANKGIGFEAAKQLAETGITVLLGARDQERGQAAVENLLRRGLDVSLLLLDTTNEASIDVAANKIEAEYGHLDILINNVGVYDKADTVPGRTSLAIIRNTMEINFIGTVAVTKAMLPLLHKSESGRIVNLSSTLGSLKCNGDPTSPFYSAQNIGYNSSKAAVNMLTVQLSQELRDTNIIVTSVCPGFVKTDLSSNMGNVLPDEAAKTPVYYALIGDDFVSGRFMDTSGEVPW